MQIGNQIKPMEASKKQKLKETKRGKKTFCKLYMCFRAMEIGHIEEDDPKGSNSKFLSPSEGEMRKKTCKRSFSSMVKVVMFGGSLAKKIKRRELLQKKCKSNGSSKNSQDHHHHLSPTNTTCSPTTPSTSRSSYDSSSLALNSSSTSNASAISSFLGSKAKQEPCNNLETGIGLHGSNVGLGLVLLVLLFVVVWGKTCAILCTAGCLFLVPKRSHSLEDGAGWRGDGYSKDYKKKVIMGGILDGCKN